MKRIFQIFCLIIPLAAGLFAGMQAAVFLFSGTGKPAAAFAGEFFLVRRGLYNIQKNLYSMDEFSRIAAYYGISGYGEPDPEFLAGRFVAEQRNYIRRVIIYTAVSTCSKGGVDEFKSIVASSLTPGEQNYLRDLEIKRGVISEDAPEQLINLRLEF